MLNDFKPCTPNDSTMKKHKTLQIKQLQMLTNVFSPSLARNHKRNIVPTNLNNINQQ